MALLLLACTFFAAPVLFYGQLQSNRDRLPPSSGPNDGLHASYFVLKARPYDVMPEDFYLYVVRGKRMADRGFAGDLLWGRNASATSPVASVPLQALLGYLAYLTKGEPARYALFLAGLIFASWTISGWIIQRHSHRDIARVPLLLACVLTFVCQSPDVLIRLSRDLFETLSTLSLRSGPLWKAYEMWPAGQGLRFSTHAWSFPLLLAIYTVSANAILTPPSRRALIAVFCILLLLALGDTWSFLLAAAVVGLAAALSLLRRVMARGLTLTGWRDLRSAAIESRAGFLITELLTTFAVFLAIPGPKGDALVRGGLGAWWRIGTQDLSPILGKYIAADKLIYAALVFLVCSTVAWFVRPRAATLSAVLTGLLPLAAGLILIVMLYVGGADPWQSMHFVDRALIGALLGSLVLIVLMAQRLSLLGAQGVSTMRRRRKLLSTLAALLLVSLWFVHALRTHASTRSLQVEDYALTKKFEALKDALIVLDSEHAGGAPPTLATLSHEVNYLAAVWTDFDLMLPEGFPLQNSGSDDEIAQRTASLLRFYGASRSEWRSFDLDLHPEDQLSWRKSRLDSERQGYNYYMFHREGAQRLLGAARPGVALLDKYLSESAITSSITPDLIVIDQTSNYFGRPDLSGYVNVLRRDELELWQRRDRARNSSLGASPPQCATGTPCVSRS